jgi:DNA polymerase-1
MQDLLYVDMSLPVQYKRRKSVTEERKITTNEEALVKLSRVSNNPVLELIMKAKKITKLLTFVDVCTSPSNRVHTCYNVTGATMLRETKGLTVDDEGEYKSFGRWSSSSSIILPYGSGNLQNVPKEARKMYVPPPGHVFVQADYKQAEAVVVSYLIGDTRLKKLFQDSFGLSDEECKARHLDVHKITAAMMFGTPVETVTADMRRVGKTIRHAVNYSAGPGVLATKLNCSTKEAKKLLDRFHNSCPQLQIWQAQIQNELRRTRTLTNLLGRKHRFIDRWGDGLFRSAYSFVPQSTVGDLLNAALVKLYHLYGEKLNIALQLHDAIYVTVEESNVDYAKAALLECMLIPLTCNRESFKIDVDFKVGKTWGDLEE